MRYKKHRVMERTTLSWKQHWGMSVNFPHYKFPHINPAPKEWQLPFGFFFSHPLTKTTKAGTSHLSSSKWGFFPQVPCIFSSLCDSSATTNSSFVPSRMPDTTSRRHQFMPSVCGGGRKQRGGGANIHTALQRVKAVWPSDSRDFSFSANLSVSSKQREAVAWRPLSSKVFFSFFFVSLIEQIFFLICWCILLKLYLHKFFF